MTTSPTPDAPDRGIPLRKLPDVPISVDALLDRAIGMVQTDAARHVKAAASSSLTLESLYEALNEVLSENARLRTWVALHDGDAQAIAEGGREPAAAETAVLADQFGSPDGAGPQAHDTAEPEPKP